MDSITEESIELNESRQSEPADGELKLSRRMPSGSKPVLAYNPASNPMSSDLATPAAESNPQFLAPVVLEKPDRNRMPKPRNVPIKEVKSTHRSVPSPVETGNKKDELPASCPLSPVAKPVICSQELQMQVTDSVDTMAWLLSERCFKFYSNLYGVSVSANKDVSGPSKSDTVHVSVSKPVDSRWTPSETQWFVDMAADSLRSLACRGLCSRKLFYKGPLSRTQGDRGPSVKEVANQLWGKDRRHLARIEQDTGSVLRLVHLKGLSSSALTVRIRSASISGLQSAEAAVAQLLESAAEYFDQKAAQEEVREQRESSTLSKDSPAYIPLEDEDQQGEQEEDMIRSDNGGFLQQEGRSEAEEFGQRNSNNGQEICDFQQETVENGLQKGPAGGVVTFNGFQKDTMIAEASDSLYGETVISCIPSTRTILVSWYPETPSPNLSEYGVRAMIADLVDERLDVPAGILKGDQADVIEYVELLDQYLAVVKLRHEQLAGALAELYFLEPTVTGGFHVELGPGDMREGFNSQGEGAAVAIRGWAKGSNPNKIYRAVHRGLKRGATPAEKHDGRKLSKGKLISHIEISVDSQQGTVFLPTTALAERVVELFSRDRRVFGDIRVHQRVGSNPREAGLLRRARTSSGSPARDASLEKRPRLNPGFIVPPHPQRTLHLTRIPAQFMLGGQLAEVVTMAMRGRHHYEEKWFVKEVWFEGSSSGFMEFYSQEHVREAAALFRLAPHLFHGIELRVCEEQRPSMTSAEHQEGSEKPWRQLDRSRCVYVVSSAGTVDEHRVVLSINRALEREPRNGKVSVVTDVRVLKNGCQAFVEISDKGGVDVVLAEYRKDPSEFPGFQLKSSRPPDSAPTVHRG